MRSFLFVTALLLAATACDAAVLLRFINAVPTRFAVPSTDAAGGHVTGASRQDRIGIQYFPDAVSTIGATSAPTVLWTEVITPGIESFAAAAAVEISNNNSPFGWSHGMPALRQYTDTTLAVNFDRITSGVATTGELEVDQSQYKADGVGLYLSFAPGTYRMQAYAVLGNDLNNVGTPFSNPIRQITTTNSVFTFEDNRVYTLVAIGDGRYSVTPTPLTGNDVTLRLFEESTAPTTFGFAALRWFHAVRSYKTQSINVHLGDTSVTPAVSGIAFGGLSDYVNVPPAAQQVTTLAASNAPTVIIAPTTATRFETTHEIRAGLRATVICAVNNDEDNRVFCRMIPSRVVAYVRLVNDLAGTNARFLGAAGPEPLSRSKLTLWASYEFPRPDRVVTLSQTGGNRSVKNTPANLRGLYKVVNSVAANVASGYGEVFVPVTIMDFAIRHHVARDATVDLGAVAGLTNAPNNQHAITLADAPATASSWSWFFFAPISRRVHFVVRTAGGATLGCDTRNWVRTYSGVEIRGLYEQAVSVDKYVEPGAFYTLFVTADGTAANVNLVIPTPQIVRHFWRRDRSVGDVATGITTGRALVYFTPFTADQAWAGNVNLRPRGSAANTGATQSVTPITGANSASQWTTTATYANQHPQAIVPTFTAFPGDYVFDHTGVVSSCFVIPGSTDLTVAAGEIWDVYLLNSYGCTVNNNDVNRLVVKTVKTQSAIETGHADDTLLKDSTAPSSAPTFFFAAAPALSVSMSMVIATIFAVVAALL